MSSKVFTICQFVKKLKNQYFNLPVFLLFLLFNCIWETLSLDIKRSPIMAQFVEQNPKTPDIHTQSLGLLPEQFWRKILSSTTHCGTRVHRVNFTCKTKVGQLGIVITIEQNILQLNISV